jgi:ubiquinone/menaquinone biosynthesis C-methylase UbiE
LRKGASELTEWNHILPEKAYSFEEPDDSVISLTKSLPKGKAALDLACGAGRHVICLAEQGFDVTGADVSVTGLKMTKERLQKRNLRANLVKCDMNHLPYAGGCFDILVCTRAIYHQRLKSIQETLPEIRRVMKGNGALLTDFLSKNTYSYGKGIRIEEGTFMEYEGHERGIIHHYADEQELKQLFRDFGNVRLSLRERVVDGSLRSRWVVTATS